MKVKLSISNPAFIKTSLLLAITIITAFEFFYLRFEYPATQIHEYGWCIHNDEKLIIPDTRYNFLKGNKQINILDYKPYPISSSFGIAGPMIATLGFKMFGMNNVGLRFFSLIIASISTALFILLLLQLAPGIIGLFFGILYVFNYNNFILQRHAILENFLTFILLTILWLYVTKPNFLLNNLFKISFSSGICVWFKPNFVVYVYLLLFLIAIIEFKEIKRSIKFILFSFAIILLFELIQDIFLFKMGIVQYRYYNLFAALSAHAGVHTELFDGTKLLQYFTPMGLMIFVYFPVLLFEWYTTEFVIFSNPYSVIITTSFLFVLMLICSIILGIRRSISRQAYVIALFITCCLLVSAFFFCYPKRLISFFPITVILIAYFNFRIFGFLARKTPDLYRIIKIFSVIIALVYFMLQSATIIGMSTRKTCLVEENSIALDNDLPKGCAIYANCPAYRFFWQVKDQRLFSGDDQILSNFRLFYWAVKDRARYILVTENSGYADMAFLEWFNSRIGKSNEFLGRPIAHTAEDRIILETIDRQVKTVRVLKVYSTTAVESDAFQRYFLMEIIYN
jgi:hypothetical protein